MDLAGRADKNDNLPDNSESNNNNEGHQNLPLMDDNQVDIERDEEPGPDLLDNNEIDPNNVNAENVEEPAPDLLENEENDDNNNPIHLQQHLRMQRQYQEHIQALNAIAEAEENFLETIGHLNFENRKLEQKINESDAQNNLLQMQLRVLMAKMENLEAFMATFVTMNDDKEEEHTPAGAETDSTSGVADGHAGAFLLGIGKSSSATNTISNCPRCGYNIKANCKLRRSESIDKEIDPSMRPSTWTSGNVTNKSVTDFSDLKNPMMIDLIVAKIVSYLPPSTLFKCRIVNHLWNSEASYQLGRKYSFKLHFDNIENISRFSSNPQSSGCLFTRLKLDLGFVVNPFRNYLQEFFQLYGPSMTHFSITCDEEFPNRIYTEELRSLFLANFTQLTELELSLPTKITERQSIYDDVRPRNRFQFPNLKSLIFNQFDNSGGYSVWFTKEILKMAPNLQSLRVETHSKEVITRVLLALGDRECRSIMGQLKHLFLDAFVTQQHLEMLSEFDLQLISLQMSYFTVEVTKEAVEGLLNRYRKSLTTLILGDYQKRPSQTSEPLILKFPTMIELTQLRFVDPCFPDQRNLHLTPLSYGVQLPKLELLGFDHEAGKPSGIHYFSDLFNGSPTPCLTLKELKISHGLNDINLIAQASKMFPNLLRLDVANLSDPVLREVWMNFTNVLDLRLELCPANVNVDSVLTGIPYEVCKKIQERNLFAQVEAMDVLDIIRTEPSICNLTKLRSIKIDGLPSTLLTAVTGYLALSQLSTLSSISIKSDVATLSRECRRVLGERLKLTLFELF